MGSRLLRSARAPPKSRSTLGWLVGAQAHPPRPAPTRHREACTGATRWLRHCDCAAGCAVARPHSTRHSTQCSSAASSTCVSVLRAASQTSAARAALARVQLSSRVLCGHGCHPTCQGGIRCR
eukprot:scaffold9783_cov127-Isochrysis_galbana.AAC.11